MKHAPQTIWLNVGEADDLDTNDFRDLSEVAWSENKVSSGDLKYVRERTVKKEEDKEDFQFLLNILREYIDSFQVSEMNLMSSEEDSNFILKIKQIARKRNLNF